jgi:integrase
MKDLDLEVHAHGFRTSFRTWTQEKTNYPREIAEVALAHLLKDKAEAAYARSDLLEKRAEMMEAWAQFISTDKSEIVQIRA